MLAVLVVASRGHIDVIRFEFATFNANNISWTEGCCNLADVLASTDSLLTHPLYLALFSASCVSSWAMRMKLRHLKRTMENRGAIFIFRIRIHISFQFDFFILEDANTFVSDLLSRDPYWFGALFDVCIILTQNYYVSYVVLCCFL